MANDLTGDFDVVAEFTVGAANRILAAMHRGGRLPHSWSLRVDDFTHVKIPMSPKTTATGIRAIVDTFGEAITNPDLVPKFPSSSAASATASPVNLNLDVPVNSPKSAAALAVQASASAHSRNFRPAEVSAVGARFRLPLHLVGVAQLQMGAPTMSLVENSSKAVTVHTPLMARYFPDDGTLNIPDWLQGEFQTTITVKEVTTPTGTSLDVVLAGQEGNAQFVPKWVNPGWDDEADQLGAINKAITNSLSSSFEPSSTPLPANVLNLQLKTLPASQTLAMMMDLPGGNPSGPPNPNSVSNVFLGGGDDFAFAISDEFGQTMFSRSINDLKQWQFSFWYSIETKIPNPVSWIGIGPDDFTITVITITFTVSLDSVTIELQNGQILVTVQGSANTPTPGIPKFSFTGTQALTLELINSASEGSTADLVTLGDPSVTASAPGIPDWAINNYFTPTAVKKFKDAVTNFLNNINPGLQVRLSAYENLGKFLTQLMNPIPKPGAPVEPVSPQLSYTSFDISPSGIVLHGSLAVPRWTKPHVEFSYRTIPGHGPIPLAMGEYSALRSWIPGGTIQEFLWNQQGGPTLHDDHHTFLFQERQLQLIHLCLTLKGTRITASGPIAYEPVTGASFCAWRSHISVLSSVSRFRSGEQPKIALTQKSASGKLEIVGHTSPWGLVGAVPENATNLIVYFPDRKSAGELNFLNQALKQSGRTDSAAAILVVMAPEEIIHAAPTDGIIFTDDNKSWMQLLKIEDRPAVSLLGTTGEVVWHHKGHIKSAELADALKKHLPAGGRFSSRLLTSGVRIGHLVPNFLFASETDRQLSLRKLVGQSVVLVFWKSSSQASLDTVLDLQRAFPNSGSQIPLVLAINDGESAEHASKVAKGQAISAIVVPDPEQDISLAFGVTVWPTVIFLDAQGLVSAVRYGRFAAELASHSQPSSPATDKTVKKSKVKPDAARLRRR